jgi:hypothetical protein
MNSPTWFEQYRKLRALLEQRGLSAADLDELDELARRVSDCVGAVRAGDKAAWAAEKRARTAARRLLGPARKIVQLFDSEQRP